MEVSHYESIYRYTKELKMNKGVEILLARMDTNPEEFDGSGRWIDLYNQFKKFMTEEEQQAVMNKLKAIKMEQFEQAMVKRLLQYEKSGDWEKVSVNDVIYDGLSRVSWKWAKENNIEEEE
jgi:sulfatase maturation enzyme AslB (radical SAM superfamily)